MLIAGSPLHILLSGPNSTEGAGKIVTIEVALAWQLLLVEFPVTVYIVVVVGETDTDELSDEALLWGFGDHEYELAPVTFNVAVRPGQMLSEFTDNEGEGITVTLAIAEPSQPFGLVAPVTV